MKAAEAQITRPKELRRGAALHRLLSRPGRQTAKKGAASGLRDGSVRRVVGALACDRASRRGGGIRRRMNQGEERCDHGEQDESGLARPLRKSRCGCDPSGQCEADDDKKGHGRDPRAES